MLETKDLSKARKKAQKYFCPFCQKRLWRLGSPRYALSDRDKLDRDKTSFLIATNFDVKQDLWLEEFLCEEHGKLWMQSQETDETVIAVVTVTCKPKHYQPELSANKRRSPSPRKAKVRRQKKKVGSACSNKKSQ